VIEFSVTSSCTEFNELAQKLSGPLKQKLVERLTDIAFAAAFWEAPVLTGYLASTVYKEVSPNEGKVGAAASYAPDVELGTAPHEIRPANGKFLAFQIAGKMVFTPVVHHPGTKANPFLRRAADLARSKVDATFAELWLDLVGG
jgi:hypothetical protein